MSDLSINIRLTQFILNLKKDDFNNFKGFIIDFFADFYSENRNYWEYESWAKSILEMGKIDIKSNIILFKKGKNEDANFNEDVIYKYSSLLKKIFDNNIFATLFCHISNEDSKSQFLSFIDYLRENYNQKEQILKRLQKMSNIGIYDFIYKKDFDLDGTYNIKTGINFSEGIFSDGFKKWLNRTDRSFPVLISGANYIIEYKKQGEMYQFITMKLKNFDFDLNTLPSKNILFSGGNELLNIDYSTSDLKTVSTNLICEIDNSLESVDRILQLYENLIRLLKKAKTEEEYGIIKTKLSALVEIQGSLDSLKSFLISEYQRENIMETSELKDSIIRKKKSL